MKLELTFIVLIISFVNVNAENSTSLLNETSNVTTRPRLTTTTPANFISSTLENLSESIRRFFSKFCRQLSEQTREAMRFIEV